MSDAFAPLVDTFGRRHTSLRLSVTDRCNIRCFYCMPENVQFQPKHQLLSFEELTRLAQIYARLGVKKIRLTGGEPLVRKDVSRLVTLLQQVAGIEEISLTTNGILLSKHAQELKAVGLTRLNISLDTLDRASFEKITRRDRLEEVLEGIAAAKQAGFERIKINAVALASVTEKEIIDLATFCREQELELRFIEFMPLEADHVWESGRVLLADDLLALLARHGLETKIDNQENNADPSAPAKSFQYVDGGGRLGIIASVSKPFCHNCNRLRLTAEGKMRNCLFSMDETDLKTPMRAGATDEDLAQLIRQCVLSKWAGHLINQPTFERPDRTMHSIGG